MCKCPQETIQEADRVGMFKSVGQCQHDPWFYSYSASYDCGGLVDVTWLPSFNVLIFKPGLGIIATQICCEDVTG